MRPRILCVLSQTHDPDGEDMKLLRNHLENALTLIARLDPNVVTTLPEWTKESASILTNEREKKITKKQANAKDKKDLENIIATLDNIPDPLGPLEPPMSATTKRTTRKRTGRGIKVVTSDA